jgi:mono/diheme cytochrome c family protein
MTLSVGLCLARGVTLIAAAQNPGANSPARRTVDGVYSEAQRQRGMLTYLKRCSSCHGESLHGGESAPALKGADFRRRWDEKTLDDLMQKVMVMPPNDPSKLTPPEGASVIAVMLASNGSRTGSEELSSGADELKQIAISWQHTQ